MLRCVFMYFVVLCCGVSCRGVIVRWPIGWLTACSGVDWSLVFTRALAGLPAESGPFPPPRLCRYQKVMVGLQEEWKEYQTLDKLQEKIYRWKVYTTH